jgi:hypothetical protein
MVGGAPFASAAAPRFNSVLVYGSNLQAVDGVAANGEGALALDEGGLLGVSPPTAPSLLRAPSHILTAGLDFHPVAWTIEESVVHQSLGGAASQAGPTAVQPGRRIGQSVSDASRPRMQAPSTTVETAPSLQAWQEEENIIELRQQHQSPSQGEALSGRPQPDVVELHASGSAHMTAALQQTAADTVPLPSALALDSLQVAAGDARPVRQPDAESSLRQRLERLGGSPATDRGLALPPDSSGEADERPHCQGSPEAEVRRRRMEAQEAEQGARHDTDSNHGTDQLPSRDRGSLQLHPAAPPHLLAHMEGFQSVTLESPSPVALEADHRLDAVLGVSTDMDSQAPVTTPPAASAQRAEAGAASVLAEQQPGALHALVSPSTAAPVIAGAAPSGRLGSREEAVGAPPAAVGPLAHGAGVGGVSGVSDRARQRATGGGGSESPGQRVSHARADPLVAAAHAAHDLVSHLLCLGCLAADLVAVEVTPQHARWWLGWQH